MAFPFGFGLSYSGFGYSDLKLSEENGRVRVRFSVEKLSDRDGKEVCQVYIHAGESFVYRPEKELKGFEKIFVRAKEKAEADILLDADAFAFYSVATDGWRTEDGVYEILVGASSRDIRLRAKIHIQKGKIVL